MNSQNMNYDDISKNSVSVGDELSPMVFSGRVIGYFPERLNNPDYLKVRCMIDEWIEGFTLDEAQNLPTPADSHLAARLENENPGHSILSMYGIEMFYHKDKESYSEDRQKEFTQQTAVNGFDVRETWNLDAAVMAHLFERLVMFIPDCLGNLDIDGTLISRDGKLEKTEPTRLVTIDSISRPKSFWMRILAEMIRSFLVDENLICKDDEPEDDDTSSTLVPLESVVNSDSDSDDNNAEDLDASSNFVLRPAVSMSERDWSVVTWYSSALNDLMMDILKAVFPHLWW
jgi:hypothetical protein